MKNVSRILKNRNWKKSNQKACSQLQDCLVCFCCSCCFRLTMQHECLAFRWHVWGKVQQIRCTAWRASQRAPGFQDGETYGQAGTGKTGSTHRITGTVNTIVNDAVMSQSARVPMNSLECLLHANECSGSKRHELANEGLKVLRG